jgi:hypothetical protein
MPWVFSASTPHRHHWREPDLQISGVRELFLSNAMRELSLYASFPAHRTSTTLEEWGIR